MDKRTNIVKLINKKGMSGTNIVKYLYAIVPVSQEEAAYVKKNSEFTTNTLERLKSEKLIQSKEDLKAALFIGKLSDFGAWEPLIYKFPQTKRQILDRKPEQFRDYTIPLDKQKEGMWLVNLASTSQISWKTALKHCNSEYGVIVQITLPNET